MTIAKKLKAYPGLWLLTLYTALFFGLIPILGKILLPFSMYYPEMTKTPVLSALSIFSLIIGMAILAVTPWVWKSTVIARNIYIGLIALINLAAAVSMAISTSERIALSMRLPGNGYLVELLPVVWVMVKGIALILIYLWYFNRPKVKAYFENAPETLSTTADLSKPSNGKWKHILLVSLTIVIIYRFICAVPFPPESWLSAFIDAPTFLFSVYLLHVLPSNQIDIILIIETALSTLFWFIVGVILASIVKKVRWALAIYLGLQILLVILTLAWASTWFMRSTL